MFRRRDLCGMRASVFTIVLAGCATTVSDRTVLADRYRATVAEVTTTGQVKNGPARLYDGHAHELKSGSYADDLKEGPWTTRAPDGTVLAELSYHHGRFHGTCRWYASNGQLVSVEPYTGGKLNGPVRRWFEDGTLRQEVNYDMGKAIGPYKRYVRETVGSGYDYLIAGQYIDGHNEGIWYTLTSDSVKTSEGRFVHDLRQGTWRFWDREGRPVREEDYVDNGLVATRKLR